MSNLVKYLAVGRLVTDTDGKFKAGKHQLVAAYITNSGDGSAKSYKDHVVEIMNRGANKLKVDKRIRLTADHKEYDLHVVASGLPGDKSELVVFFAVTDVGFMKAYSVSQLFEDFKGAFFRRNDTRVLRNAKTGGQVNANSQSLMESLASKYGTSKLAEVQGKVSAVTNVMRDNINKAVENVDALEDLEMKAEDFEKHAESFSNDSSALKRHMRCKVYKVTALILLVLAIIITIIVVVATKDSKKD